MGMLKMEPLPIRLNWGMLFPMIVAPRQMYMVTERQ